MARYERFDITITVAAQSFESTEILSRVLTAAVKQHTEDMRAALGPAPVLESFYITTPDGRTI